MNLQFPSFSAAPALPYLQHSHTAPPAIAFSCFFASKKKRPRRSQAPIPSLPSRLQLSCPPHAGPAPRLQAGGRRQDGFEHSRDTKPRGRHRGNIPNPSATSGQLRGAGDGFGEIFFLTDAAPCAEPPSEASGGAAPLLPRPGRSLRASEAFTNHPQHPTAPHKIPLSPHYLLAMRYSSSPAAAAHTVTPSPAVGQRASSSPASSMGLRTPPTSTHTTQPFPSSPPAPLPPRRRGFVRGSAAPRRRRSSPHGRAGAGAVSHGAGARRERPES